jgi:hypothetical protein
MAAAMAARNDHALRWTVTPILSECRSGDWHGRRKPT